MHDFHAWRRRATLPPALAALALACAAAASAATPPGGVFNSTNTTAQFTGTLLATNMYPGGDPVTGSPCPDQTLDSADATCGHFHVTTQVAGAVHTCVSFAASATDIFGMSDLDVYVIDETTSSSTFEQIIAAATTDNNPECVDFDGVATGEYEIQVNPAFVTGPTDYTGSVFFTPGATTAKAASSAGPEMEGSGQVADLTQFNVGLAVLEPKENKLKVKSSDGGPCAFKASGSSITVDNWGETLSTDSKKLNGDMGAHGSGTNFGKPVMFKVQVHDGGNSDGSGDTFKFSTDDGACSVSGPLIKGHVEYEISK